MATLKIWGMRVNVTLSDNSSTVSGERTKEIFCPNYKYYENEELVLNKSAYYLGMLNRTCFSLAGLSTENLVLKAKPIAMVFDGEPEIFSMRIIAYVLNPSGTRIFQDIIGTIGRETFPLLSDNEVDLSNFSLSDFESGDYASKNFFGYCSFIVQLSAEKQIQIAEIGY